MRLISILAWAAIIFFATGPSNDAWARGWSRSGDKIIVSEAGIRLSTKIGSLSLKDTGEFSAKGEGIDNFAQYRSADEQVFATVYVYYPGLAHSGLAAYATGRILQASQGVRKLDSNLVKLGGIPNAAIRETFTGYRDNLASAAAFAQVGRWIIKFRVSGPEARASEVFAGLDALLADVSFSREKPSGAAPLSISPCDSKDRENASPNARAPAVVDVAELVLLNVDGSTAPNKKSDSSWHRDHLGQAHCLVASDSQPGAGPWILHPVGSPKTEDAPRAELLAIINDAGAAIEVLRLGKTHRVLLHQIGSTTLLGAFDSLPSDAQILAILSGQDGPGSRSEAVITFVPGRSPEIHIMTPSAANERPVT